MCCCHAEHSLSLAVIPYMPYSRQNRMQKRGCIVAKLMANMLAKAGELLNHKGVAVGVADVV